MANSTQPEKQDFELVEVSETVASVPDLKTELLHHLVNVSSVVQETKPDKAAAEELVKKNTSLVRELLNSSIVATNPAQAIVWKRVLVQKLDGKIRMAETMEEMKEVQEFVERMVEEKSKKIDEMIDEFVNIAAAFKTFENTIKFAFEPGYKKSDNASQYRLTTATHEIFLHGLRFSLTLYGPSTELILYCYDLPAGKDCKATIKVTVKNQAGEKDFVRTFKKVFVSTKPTTSNGQSGASSLYVSNLIAESEYADESLGLMKDGKLNLEVFVRVDEVFDKPKPVTALTATTTATTATTASPDGQQATTTSSATPSATSSATSSTTEQKVASQ